MLSIATVLNPCILLVKTDEAFAQQASQDLIEAGYTTAIAPDIDKALLEIETLQPAMVVIDRALAGESGLRLCRQLRQKGDRVLIILSIDQETVEERVKCLEAGADDYLLKPYHSKEFLQMVRFYLHPREASKEQLRFGELVLDLTTRRLILGEQGIDLTMKEFELLKYLMSHPREVLSREQILENVWGYDFRGESNVIEVYIRYLRLKIENEGQKRLIHTVRGVGYVLRES
ncbi:MAG: response regulator transcription factor [Hydrococcus sp. C42_A2020_068]|uniref:response regulator transcription factor NblR n=1 Tax=Pleurocapsa sp. PCC 7327 TaxID=118163 RepID=UPI00029FFCB8|nr:response regulator transcription factor [Pleurocapsa sp. PCC 7327]AFY78283.1 response regulator with CheY-like receiver domain and winged-helix DNA-binding domain [Pleurocapsa sp. PCC 7327]MBF2020087.1 response regulator transcription factor [Hydrococcus sp. C42_A2020_068]